MLIKIIPKSSRAKNRVKEHGEVMVFIKQENGRFLVESVNNTFNTKKWLGWFGVHEATYEVSYKELIK